MVPIQPLWGYLEAKSTIFANFFAYYLFQDNIFSTLPLIYILKIYFMQPSYNLSKYYVL